MDICTWLEHNIPLLHCVVHIRTEKEAHSGRMYATNSHGKHDLGPMTK